MAQGKFSKPRSHSEEDRQIEQTYRQMTEPESPPDPQRWSPEVSDDDIKLFPERQELSQEEDPIPDTSYEADDSVMERLMELGGRAWRFCQKNNKIALTVACSVALVLIVTILVILFTGSSDPYGGKILNNVLIADIHVGGMTKSEAITAVREATEEDYATQYMVINLNGTTLRLAPADVNATLDIKAAVDAAYNYGRVGTQAERQEAYQNSLTDNHIIALLPYLSLNEEYIMDVLNTYVKDASSILTQPSFELEGTMPELSTDKFDPDAPCQTLVITTGIPGVSFDVEAAYARIQDAYSLRSFTVTIEDVQPVADPNPVDLEAIYEEVSIDPVDATVNMTTYEPVPGSYGYGFDIEKAQQLVDQAGYGDQIRISMEYIEPEILENEVFYQDVLGEAQTPHTQNENRNTNLRLACAALNGLTLNPGETFSFNDTLGKRTSEKGYKPAPAYSNGETVESIGGGICQVSSTLYYCTLLSDLAIVSRTNHSYPSSYIDYGMDATVSWGSPDFQFQNSSNFPIKIEAEVSDGYVKIRILGTDKRNYYVKMEYAITNTYTPDTEYEDYPYDNTEGYQDGDVIREGVTGYYVKTYKLKYDKETNALISRDFVANSQYKTVNKLVARVAPPPTESTTPPEPTDSTVPPESSESTVPPESSESTDPPEYSESTVPSETTEGGDGSEITG